MRSFARGMFCVMCAVTAGAAPLDEVNTDIGTVSHLLVPVFPTIQRPNSMMRLVPANHDAKTDVTDGLCLSVAAHRNGNAFRFLAGNGKIADSMHIDQQIIKPYFYSVYLMEGRTVVSFAPAEKAAILSVKWEGPGAKTVSLVPTDPHGAVELQGQTLSGFDWFHGQRVCFWMEADAPLANAGKNQFRCSPAADTVKFRYGISFISPEQARKNLEAEIPAFDFDKVAADAKQAWEKTLGQIEITGGTSNERAVFYSALYRCHERMTLNSEKGHYAWKGKIQDDGGVPFWTDDWTWDTFRAKHPLNVILHPKAEGEQLASYIRMAEQTGRVPTFPTFFGDAHCMNGRHFVALFLDAWHKGVRNFDFRKAYDLSKRTMLEYSMIPWFDGPATALDKFYWEHGFFPALKPGEAETEKEVSDWEKRQAVAVTLANAYDSWCMAEMARELGLKNDADFFAKHAQDYRNLWNPATHFFHPKDKDGKWIEPFDYKYSGRQGTRDYYDENNGWTYRWDVAHDIPGLVELFGSPDAFTQALDQLFVEGPGRRIWEFYNALPDSTGLTGMFVMGNEPSLHIPFLYPYVGAPWKTQKRVRMLLDTWWRNDRMGICGDEDGGGLSAFAIFSMMGLYPVTAGRPAYAFCSPVFSSVRIHLENGKTFTVEAPAASRANKYIRAVTLNGKPWTAIELPHAALTEGGTLRFDLTDRPCQTAFRMGSN